MTIYFIFPKTVRLFFLQLIMISKIHSCPVSIVHQAVVFLQLHISIKQKVNPDSNVALSDTRMNRQYAEVQYPELSLILLWILWSDIQNFKLTIHRPPHWYVGNVMEIDCRCVFRAPAVKLNVSDIARVLLLTFWSLPYCILYFIDITCNTISLLTCTYSIY